MAGLEDQIRREGGDPEFLKGLWGKISTDKLDEMETFQEIFKGIYPPPDSGEEEPHCEGGLILYGDPGPFMPSVSLFVNSVNRRCRKGWRPDEMAGKTGPETWNGKLPTIVPGSVHAAGLLRTAEEELWNMGANADYSSIDSVETTGACGESQVIKVGRNDPCPCGSGKKYKRCHGR